MNGQASIELGMALRQSHCNPREYPSNWILFDRVDSTRAQPGSLVQARWPAILPRNAHGHFGYVRTFAIRCTVDITAAGVSDAYSAYALRQLFDDINLQDETGHKYFAAIRGTEMVDLQYYMHGKLRQRLGEGIVANVPAGTVTRRIDLLIPLVSSAVGADPREGLINVSTLQKATSEAFQFRLRDSLLGQAGPTAPVGLTLPSSNAFKQTDGTLGLELWAEVIYLPPVDASTGPDVAPVVDGPWAFRSYTLDGDSQVLEGRGSKTQLAHIRYRLTDSYTIPGGGTASGQTLAQYPENGKPTMEVGGRTYMSALRQVEVRERAAQLKRDGVTMFADSADMLGIADLQLPAQPSVVVSDVYMLPYKPENIAPAGPVIVRFADQVAASTRWLHLMRRCDTTDRTMTILKSASGKDGCGCDVAVLGANSPTSAKTMVAKAAA